KVVISTCLSNTSSLDSGDGFQCSGLLRTVQFSDQIVSPIAMLT
ncbi:uncharacterized protein METZ01_LOCUS441762, partial [marine metagenome]